MDDDEEEEEEEEDDRFEEADSDADYSDGTESGLIDVQVTTLVGVIFELRLSPLETVGAIKNKLQRLEGIPRQQMHILHRGQSR
jgi:hypothetical protein